jgi:hypothetical protein
MLSCQNTKTEELLLIRRFPLSAPINLEQFQPNRYIPHFLFNLHTQLITDELQGLIQGVRWQRRILRIVGGVTIYARIICVLKE